MNISFFSFSQIPNIYLFISLICPSNIYYYALWILFNLFTSYSFSPSTHPPIPFAYYNKFLVFIVLYYDYFCYNFYSNILKYYDYIFFSRFCYFLRVRYCFFDSLICVVRKLLLLLTGDSVWGTFCRFFLLLLWGLVLCCCNWIGMFFDYFFDFDFDDENLLYELFLPLLVCDVVVLP